MALQKTEDPRLENIQLPTGFRIEIFAEKVENARSMVMGEKGTLFVGTRKAGKVYAIVDNDNDYKADKIYTIARNMNLPNGVAFANGALYVAALDKVYKFNNIENKLDNPGKPELISDAFPDDGHHGWKYIAFGPDGKLYIPVGAPCNICEKEDERYATIMRMNADGSQLEVFAKGIRNTVGFDWHPESKELWFTDNGTDRLGDNFPPDELNRAPKMGMHFGFPYCHVGEKEDENYGAGKSCSDYTGPALKLTPHGAALGMLFYTGSMFPSIYKNQILIAEHGSWNRTEPIGYRVMLATLNEKNEATEYKPFAKGWLNNGKAWGRPVDILQLKDGSILVSDDFADCIYRIYYGD